MASNLLWELQPHISSSHIYTRSIYFSQQLSSYRVSIEKNQRETRRTTNQHKKDRIRAR
ncbi:hypothetical protein LguiA_008654 [Lonicera macranthoides]